MNYSEAIKQYHGKPYYSLDAFCKDKYNSKCYKIALNAHMSCPNRDGHLGFRGCIFCSSGGSGDFAIPTSADDDIEAQLDKGIALFKGKNTGNNFIAYFQAYTNTYAPIAYLKKVYTQALDSNRVCGISIATRPDCISDEVIALLIELGHTYPDKFIWIELGLQSIHEETAVYIRRGYPLSCFDDTFRRLKQAGIPTIVHIILGLQGETTDMILQTVRYINNIHPFGVKLQLLHVLEGTDLAYEYTDAKFDVLDKDEYIDLVIDCIECLSPGICIHRVTGDGPKDLLIAPKWSLDKRGVLNLLHRKMKETNSYQGKRYSLSQ